MVYLISILYAAVAIAWYGFVTVLLWRIWKKVRHLPG
jgi:hypothetical protein